MGADIFVFAEELTPEGWKVVESDEKEELDPELEEFYHFQQEEFYDLSRFYHVYYTLTGYVHYRIDISLWPAPIVTTPRGVPADASPLIAKFYATLR